MSLFNRSSSSNHDPWASFRVKEFRYFILYRFLFTVGVRMMGVIVGWQIYQLTHDPLSLGLVGLAEAIPYLTSSLFTGHVADIVNRKKLIVIFTFMFLVCSALLLFFTFHFSPFIGVIPIYTVIFLTGIARGFLAPAVSAYLAQIVPRELYANSSAWNSNVWQTAAVTGPALGGLVYGFAGVTIAYGSVCFLIVLSLLMTMQVSAKPLPVTQESESLRERLTAGIRFVFNTKPLLTAISLDLFAVLFGGAVAVLPIFASDVLKVGPEGLGFLNAAPFLGSVIMGLIVASLPPMREAGRYLLICVTGFGVTTILFALSTNFYLSFALLVISGMFDSVSVIIRSTIQQLMTPDHMRGRVSAVNNIFVGSSNELGAFESGTAAKLMGLVPSVVFGGTVTLLVVGYTYLFVPSIKRLNLNKM